jgi:hypothetical protein
MASNCERCRNIGITPVANKRENITYPSTQMNHKYSLGNDLTTDDPQLATDEFMKRDFPEILDMSQPHGVIFIPDAFQFGPTGSKIVINNADMSTLTKSEETLTAGWKGNIEGDVVEETLFNKLRKTLETFEVQNTLVINGWRINKEREHDFLILSEPLNTIFHIEVKKKKAEAAAAAKQLQSGMEFFTKSLVLPAAENWIYVRIMYIAEASQALPGCTVCPNFFLTPETNLNDWWTLFVEKRLQAKKKILI